LRKNLRVPILEKSHATIAKSGRARNRILPHSKRLDAETLAEVSRRNSLSDNENTCATHDFCDANQAMIDALQTFGLDFDQAEIALVNTAWDIAKSWRFIVAEAVEN
jgi:hypothetical protein